MPAGRETIRILSQVYTESVGPWAMVAYVVGAVVVLYSTLFAGTAGWTRTFADAFAQAGWLDYSNATTRFRWIRALAVLLPLIWTALGLHYRQPVAMVAAGGIANAALLLVVVLAALVFRYRKLPEELRPGLFYDCCLWLSIVSIAAAAVIALVNALS